MLNAKELVHELQEMRDQGFLSDALLRHAVKSIAGSDERYDWVGAFLVRDTGENLWLHNYVGGPAEYAETGVGPGVLGGAVSQKGDQIVEDVAALEGYLPCNPEIRSELVVLIRAGDEVFGGINLGSEQLSAFKAEDQEAVAAAADKLAEQIVAERR
jgi:putative methionine-R-sulfoxide reductase with GAF domain